MPVTIKCRGCGYTLYSGGFMTGAGRHGQSTTTQRVSRKHGGRCPNCGRTLKPSEARVIGVSPADEP